MSMQSHFLSVPERIHQHALANPEKTAIIAGGQRISYGQVDALSDRLAWGLKKYGYAKETIIGFFLEQTHWVIVLELALQKAGLACMPLTKNYPDERVRYCMKNATSPLLITDEEGIFGEEGFQTVLLHDLLNQAEPVELEYPCESDLFACLYTSGSTGVPKGILLEQGNIVHNLESLTTLPYSEFLREDRILVASSFSFVMFVIYFFVALCNGKTVCVPSIEELKDSELLLSLIEREKVRTLISTRSLVEALLAHPQAKNMFCHIRAVSVAGEAVSSHFVRALYKVHQDAFLINSYGCTEICFLSATRLTPELQRILVGRPIVGTEVLIVDKKGQILPVGQKGNLLVSGPCVMRGYLNLANENARAFTTIQGKRFFHTGDIAVLTENGELEILGRSDDVVKYHGQRVDLKEIEKVAQIVDEISSCYALLKEDILHLFFTAERKIPSSELSAHLHRYLPDYMMPTLLHQLEKMPCNDRGKIDRFALQAMDIVAEGEAPKTALEKSLCAKIAQILGCNFVSVTDSLFSLGLTSLSAMRFCAELAQALHISTADIKESTTIRDLAERIEQSKSIDRKYEKRESFPLMENQRGIYLEWRKDSDSLKYNIPFSMTFPGLPASRVEEALQKLVAKHPIITAGIIERNDGLFFHSPEREQAVITKQHLNHEPEEVMLQALVVPFDLKQGPLYHFILFDYPSGCTLFADFHHIMFDGFSLSVFKRHLIACLEGRNIPNEVITACEYSIAEKAMPLEEARRYFASLTEDATVFSLPATEEGDGSPFEKQELLLPLAKIRSFCSHHKVSLSGYLHAAFALTVARLSRDKHPLFLIVQNGRRHMSLAHTIGMFVQTVPFVVDKEPDKTLSFIRAVEKQLEESQKFNFYSYPRFVEEQGLQAEALFTYQGELFQDSRARHFFLERKYPLFPIDLAVSTRKDNRLFFSLVYDGKRYTKEMMSGLLDGYSHLVETMCEQERVADLCLVRDIPHVLSVSKGPVFDYDRSKTWVDFVLQQIVQRPDKLAVADESSEMSYAELDILSNKVAAFLFKKGIGEGEFVAIALHRRKEFIAVVLGIHKAGLAYLPIDIELPEERKSFIIKDSETRIVITDETLQEIFATEPYEGINKASPEGKAYVIYTSGTTGRPKGVVIQHKAFLNYIQSICILPGFSASFTESHHIASHDSFSFDANLFSLAPILTRGGSVHIIPEEARRDIVQTRSFLKKHSISISFFTPAFAQLLGADEEIDLDTLVVGGEGLTSLPKTRGKIINSYGPTEFTIAVAYIDLDKTKDYARIPIGRPFLNCAAFIVDSANQLVPLGLPGELCLAGPQMSAGYWKLPEKTASVFSSIMLGEESCPVYHTGDFCYWSKDNQIEYLGRIDTQIKLRGYRIELGEIESCASKFAGIVLVSALVKAGNIALFFTGIEKIEVVALKTFLAKRLPQYMMPRFFLQLESIPKTRNGKIDRQALSSIELPQGEYIAPETALEKRICELYASILGRERVSVEDSFFDLGGTSLSTARLLSQLHTTPLSFQDILTNPSPRALASCIATFASSERETKQERTHYPFTKTQLDLYLEELSLKKPLYTMHILLKASPELSAESIIATVKKVLVAYPSLFWCIERNAHGIPEMRMRPDLLKTFSIPLIEGEKESCIQSCAHPISLDDDLLLRCAVLKTPSACFLALTVHHLLFDGTSVKIFIEECNRVLEGKALRGESYTLQDAALREERLPREKSRAYYESLFGKLRKNCKLSGDRNGGVKEGKVFSMRGLEREQVSAFCTSLRITENAFFQTVMALLLSKYLHCEETVFLTGYNGRTIEAMQDTIGVLFKNILIAVKVQGDMELAHLLKAVNQQLIASMSYEAYPYYEILRDYELCYSVELIYQGGDLLGGWQGTKLQVEPWPEEDGYRQIGDSSIFGQIFPKSKEYELEFIYRSDCFSELWISQFASDFFAIAKGMLIAKLVRDIKEKVFCL